MREAENACSRGGSDLTASFVHSFGNPHVGTREKTGLEERAYRRCMKGHGEVRAGVPRTSVPKAIVQSEYYSSSWDAGER